MSGVVINVVTNVISTNITKIGGVRIFMSYPIVNTTNSINPLVFIKAPI